MNLGELLKQWGFVLDPAGLLCGKRIAGTAAFVDFGRRGKTQGAAEGTRIAILLLTESLRQRNEAREKQLWDIEISI